MYVDGELIVTACLSFTAVCVAAGWLIKIIKGLKKPADNMNDSIKGNKDKIKEQEDRLRKIEDTLDYLVNANNLTIRSLFTVLGELAANNDKEGHIANAQTEIQNFLTPLK